MGNGEGAVLVGLHPKLIRLEPFLKIVGAVMGPRLLFQTDPDSGVGGVGIAAVVDDNLACHRTASRSGNIVRMLKPSIRPCLFLRVGLSQRVLIKQLRRLPWFP